MPQKSLIVDELGERALLLPQRLQEALAANDRVKLRLTLLQAAERHAGAPDGPAPDFRAERRAFGLADAELDGLVADSRREPDGRLHIPGAERQRGKILEDIGLMLAPLSMAGVTEAEHYKERQDRLQAALPDCAADQVPAGAVDAITSADRRRGDSLHLLVMDMHKALNRLQAGLAEEVVDGAHVWQVRPEDRPLIRAFMAGIKETAPLKFDHPGLDTTATRSGERLIIQNDIGTTDAHVLVVHVEGMAASVTYTDVHAQRLAFFRALFEPFQMDWQDTRARHGETLAGDANYYLSLGRYEAPDQAALERFLAFLGSRIVFLIDWNRARKRLREFLRKHDAVRLLRWAAVHNVGHRGFLKLGGEQLLYEAIEFAQQTPLRYGERLFEMIGPEAALDCLKFVLRASTEGLLQGRSERFIRDEVKAELARHFRSAQESLLSIASKHGQLIFDLASSLRDGLLAYAERGGAKGFALAAERARGWEQEADALVSRMRALIQRPRRPQIYLELLQEADDAADGLEEAAFLATFLPETPPEAELLQPVLNLATLLVGGAAELVKLMEGASHVSREGAREDLQDCLVAVDRLVAIEHETDAAEREATRALLSQAADFRMLHLLSSLARCLEESADALSRSALKLRDHLLNDVMGA
jgi:uncharacterized protein Yka (UPF0111/DUF47 family)